MPGTSTISLAMSFFGKLSCQPKWAAEAGATGAQGIKGFKDDFDRLDEQGKADLLAGLSGGDARTLTY